MADSGENAGSKPVIADRDADRAAFLSGAWKNDDEKSDDTIEGDDGDDESELEVDLDDDLEGEASDEGDEDESDEDAEKPTEDDAKRKDAETEKRMDAIRRREQRSREQLASERRAFESERDAFVKEWKPRIEAAERFEAMKAKGVTAYTVADVLAELGLPESEYLDASRALYALSTDGKKDPKNAEAIARARKERERDDEVRALKRKLEERESAEVKEREQAQAKEAATKYLDKIAKAAPTGTLAAHYLKANPEKTRAQLGNIAMQLSQKSGDIPTEKQVLAAYEKARAKQLRSLGVDPTTITKAAPPRVATKPGEKKNAKPANDDADDDKPLTKEEFVKLRSVPRG